MSSFAAIGALNLETSAFDLIDHAEKSLSTPPVAWLSPKLKSVLQDSTQTSVAASNRLFYWLQTFWLITYTDLKTNMIPCTLFAIITTCSICLRLQSAATPSSTLIMSAQVLMSTPVILGWVYLNNLPFASWNQVSACAIEEDRINKPWRPIPAGRITAESVGRLIAPGYLVALAYSYYTHTMTPALFLVFLGWCYNGSFVKGSENWALRTLLNAFGFTSFLYGALQAALFQIGVQHGSGPLSAWAGLKWWFAIIGCVICGTVHVLDIYDQEGDAARGRLTLPLVIGDRIARRILALASIASSIGACYFWDCLGWSGILPLSLGALVAVGTMSAKTPKADKKVAVFWIAWMMSLYTLPLMQAMT